MKKLMLTVATAALGLGMALPGQAQTTDADCEKMFEIADVNKDGSLGAGESDKFVVLMSTKPKDAAMVTMEEFLADCRKDSFKSIQEAALTPAPDSNAEAKSSSDTATAAGTAAQGSTAATTTTEQSASAEQPAASTTTTTESTATTEQPATSSTTETTVTAEQPSTSTETVEQPSASTTTTETAEQPAATTAEQPAATTAEQPAATTAEQPAATTTESTTAEQPAATAEASSAGSAGDMLASKLIGTTVVSNDNQNIGEINDIVIDVENEKAAHAIIGVGGFLGIGEKNVAVELSRLNVRTDANTGSWTVVMDTTEDELKQMPEYQAAAK